MADKPGNAQLFVVLSKVTEGKVKGIDESYLDNLLTVISADLHSPKLPGLHLTNWINTIQSNWPKICQDTTVTNFLMQLCAILVTDQKCFVNLQDAASLDNILNTAQAKHQCSAIRSSYLKAISQLSSHDAGVAMLRKMGIWRIAVELALSDPSMYVRRHALECLRLILAVEKDNIDTCKEIIQEIINPALKILEATPGTISEEAAENAITLSLKLVDGLLDDLVTNANANNVGSLLINHFKLDVLLTSWLDNSSKDSLVDTLLTTYSTLILTSLPDDGPGEIPGIFALYHSLLNSKRTSAFITLSRICHKLWARMRERRPNADDQIEMHFFMMQLIPLMGSIRKSVRIQMRLQVDQYVNKLFDRLSSDTFRMCYTLRDTIHDETPQVIAREANKALHGLMDIRKLLHRDKVVIAFQSLAWIMKNFVPATCDGDDQPDESEVLDARQLCESAAPLLHTILHALSTLIDEYHFVWSEAFEGLCVLKLCYWLLKTPLCVKGHVLTLRLTKLCIQQCMPPSLVLLLDCIEGTSLEAVVPELVRKLHDPHWEVRDSSLEVIAVVSDLARVKYPVFQDVLLNLNCGSLAVNMMADDIESYVRASAIHTVAAMVTVDKIWNESLVHLRVNNVIQSTIRNDTEGVVRREAAILVTNLLRYGRIQSSEMDEVRHTMQSVVVNDLHWEARVNALQFWEEVIDIELQEEAMVDGVFPSVTFSKTSKKIVTLTTPEIQTRLLRVLKKLSDIGCLNALLSALTDDCDDEVVVAASKVVKKLMDVLSMYHLVPPTAVTGKRKHSPDRRQSRHSSSSSSGGISQQAPSTSENVIDSIISSSDLKLLANVVNQESGEVTFIDQPIAAQSQKKQPITVVTPDVFLARMQEVDLGADKSANVGADLAALLEDVLSLDKDEDHVPDCY